MVQVQSYVYDKAHRSRKRESAILSLYKMDFFFNFGSYKNSSVKLQNFFSLQTCYNDTILHSADYGSLKYSPGHVNMLNFSMNK